MLIIGDVHLQENWIKRKQVELFFDWLNNQDFFKKESNIIFLGDLFEIPTPSSSLVSFYLNLFLNIWKNKFIYILQGNHDYNLSTNSLDFFESLDNVKIIKEYEQGLVENKKCLFLPYYSYEGTDKEPMQDFYSSLKGEYDYIFGHIEDETQHFGDKFCDLKNVKGKRVFGHIHAPDIQNLGNYLGSCIKNSSTEKDDQKYVAAVDDSGLILYDVPSFMIYESIKYGEDIKETEQLVSLNITDAPSKMEAVNLYESKYSNVKVNKVITKRQQILENEKIIKNSELDNWNLFCKEKDLTETVKSICEGVIKD